MQTEQGIDLIGRKILLELATDGRLPLAELARKVGLSASATAERVRHLESVGVIRGYHAEIDFEALGYGIVAFIRLTCEGSRYRQFLKFLPTLDPIQECHHLTGADAFLLKVMLSNMSELESLIESLLPYGSPTTSMVLSTPLERKPQVAFLLHL